MKMTDEDAAVMLAEAMLGGSADELLVELAANGGLHLSEIAALIGPAVANLTEDRTASPCA
ncbi:hypothetical protein OH807_30910 [Kitasatospora sp. NBC_01560]|uniref:hypothetical protein n=1 Tax=Kitasatospora sp. NBC_01560 TaxID=2975965 RepID=UPI00386AF836